MSVYEELGEQKAIELSQGTVSYRETGQGQPPVVLIHGLLVNGDLWRKVVPGLAGNYRCLAPDLPLGAHSTGLNPDADLTPPGIARLISDFIEALDLRNVILVGSDTGGAFCQLVITSQPDRIERLILTNCDAFENFFPALLAPMQWQAHLPGAMWGLGQLSKWSAFQRLLIWLVAKYPVEQRAIKSYVGKLGKDREVRRDLGKVLRGISKRHTLAAAKEFGNFNKPVLVAWGKQDFLFPARYAKRLAAAFPQARVEFVDNSRAFVAEDQPEWLTDVIKNFLAETTGSGLELSR
ncbi:MAG: alpha/beta hydrolase [Chloroflexi bacterium]|nr:alpha/beta hydrolase [Chloroflexota bacterium]OJV92304.1 MAG: hypothetical protein BGO39_30665 [Chloroflexi bacterium 54-19]